MYVVFTDFVLYPIMKWLSLKSWIANAVVLNTLLSVPATLLHYTFQKMALWFGLFG